MKNIKRFSAVIGAAALFALAFTGCENFAGTEVNYSEKEVVLVGDSGVTKNLSSAAITTVEVQGVENGSIAKASSQTTIKIKITNNATKGRINLKSFEKAVEFWSLKSNDNAAFFKLHDEKLPAKKFAENEEGSTTASTATLEFEVDTSSVTTNQIALIINAKELKDKQGKYILNLDKNNKRGEESDSFIQYIAVGAKANGDLADSLVGIDENFRPAWDSSTGAGWSPITSFSINESLDDSSDYTGDFEVRANTYKYHLTAYDDTIEYNKELASDLNSSTTLRIRKPNSSTTDTKSLSFSWDEDKNYYVASIGYYEPGTRLEVIAKESKKEFAPAWYVDMYGHKAFEADNGAGAKARFAGPRVANLYKEAPDYIVEADSTSEVKWEKTKVIDLTTIAANQKSYLTVSAFNGRFCTVSVKDVDLTLDGTDFLIIDTNNNIEYKLPFKTKIKYYDGNDANKDKIKEIEFEITNKNIALKSPKLYVGQGTSISKNENHVNQTKFGKYKDAADGIHSGYVALN